MKTYTYSIIIIAHKIEDVKESLESISRLQYPKDKYEIIYAEGKNPSLQRNKASEQANFEVLLFLDNDSILHPKILHYYNDAFNYSEDIEVVGGPTCEYSGSTSLQKSINIVFSSIFGLGPIRARYTPIGHVRPSDEKELILCNLAIKKDLFLKSDGFNIKLYPNEENEFLNKVNNGKNVWYHPLAIVYRHQRKNFKQFIIQMLKYGQGRVKHYRFNTSFTDYLYFIPAAFSIYIISLPIIIYLKFYLLLIPAIAYLILNLAATFFNCLLINQHKTVLSVPTLFFSCHFFYGLGIIKGLLYNSKEICLDTVNVKKLTIK